jgi:hypothetical protein
VDYIIGDSMGIEVKATRKVAAKDLKGLTALSEEGVFKQLFLVSHDPQETKEKNIHCLHWTVFLERLWSGRLLR